MKAIHTSLAALVLLGLASCAGETAVADVRLELSWDGGVITDTLAHEVFPTALDENGQPVPGIHLFHNVSPIEILKPLGMGRFRCRSSGTGRITISHPPLRESVEIECALVASLSAPDSVFLLAGDSGLRLEATALDENGSPNPHAVIQTRSTHPDVIRVRGDSVFGLHLGVGTVEWQSETVTSNTKVAVGTEILSTTLSIEDGGHEVFLLQPGRYQINLEVKASDESFYGVSLDWIGGSCPARPESRIHGFECELDRAATLRITNPSIFRIGPSEAGWLRVVQLPEMGAEPYHGAG